jgi:hypothetical protein
MDFHRTRAFLSFAKMKTIISLFFTGLLFCACDRAPTPVVNQTPVESHDRQIEVVSQEPKPVLALEPDVPLAPEPTAAPVKPVYPRFANSGASEAAEAYAAALADLKNQPASLPTIGQDAVTNPSAVIGSINQLASKLNALTQAKEQVEANLAPSERQRWKEFQHHLETNDQP